MTEDKKPEFSQYNIDGKALEAFLGPARSQRHGINLGLEENARHSERNL